MESLLVYGIGRLYNGKRLRNGNRSYRERAALRDADAGFLLRVTVREYERPEG